MHCVLVKRPDNNNNDNNIRIFIPVLPHAGPGVVRSVHSISGQILYKMNNRNIELNISDVLAITVTFFELRTPLSSKKATVVAETSLIFS